MVDVPDSPEPEAEPATGPGHVKKMISLFSNGFVVTVNGSEPSLTSRNGKSQASKRTLYSEEISPDSPSLTNVNSRTLDHQSSLDDVDNNVQANYVASRILTLEGLNGDVDPDKLINVSPKAPSYIKLSCSISGYSKSNSCVKNDLNKNSSYDRNNVLENQVFPEKCVKDQLIHEAGDLEKTDNVLQNGRVEGHEFSRSNLTDINVDSTSADVSSVISNGANFHTDLHNDHSRTHKCADIVEPDSSSGSQGFHQVELVAPSDTQTSPEHQTGQNQALQNGIQEKESPKKNGNHFVNVVNGEEKRLRDLVTNMEGVLQNTPDIPDEACGLIRATIGKSNLLITKKFVQYRQFCHKNVHPDPTDTRCTTDADLAGLWDIICLQITELGMMFDQIETLRKHGWKTPTLERKNPVSTPTKAKIMKISQLKKPKDASRDAQAARAREEARVKAREEAKKRLLAAKKAGRQRKASQSDDVEIYVPT